MEEKQVFVVFKPEGSRYLGEIVDELNENGFEIDKIFYISNYKELAVVLYSHMSDDKYFWCGLLTYLDITGELFGNEALVALLKDTEQRKRIKQLQDLHRCKISIRNKISLKQKRRYMIIADIGWCFDGNEYDLILKEPEVRTLGKGVWDKIFFTYIHAPDPSLSDFKREYTILEKYFNKGALIPHEIFQEMKSHKKYFSPLSTEPSF